MTHPLITLMKLNAIASSLDEVQATIDLGRKVAAEDQLVQLELDRHQTIVDARRATVEMSLLHIASLN